MNKIEYIFLGSLILGYLVLLIGTGMVIKVSNKPDLMPAIEEINLKIEGLKFEIRNNRCIDKCEPIIDPGNQYFCEVQCLDK